MVPESTSIETAAGSHPTSPEINSLKDLSEQQVKSGLAAWLGWLFDGLDMHLYILVAAPFVAQLLGKADTTDAEVRLKSAWIQAFFLFGWAFGGSLFGQVSDRLGRSRALRLTILTYALFTGLSYFAQTWWQLLILRFIAALGIGGEWAVGASLLSETWPKKWRPWIAAVLQTGVNLGILLAVLTNAMIGKYGPRYVFLVGVLPAFLTLWIRRAVPEPEEWHQARKQSPLDHPNIIDLFHGSILKTTLLTLGVCSLGLTAHWAFTFWLPQYVPNHPEIARLSKPEQDSAKNQAVMLVMIASIVGNFLAGFIAKLINFRVAIASLSLAYFLMIYAVFRGDLPFSLFRYGLVGIGLCQGLFALYTMYLPPLFPTLMRTTGAGFCYNFGRIIAGFGTVFFGLVSRVGDHREAILASGYLFLPAAVIACFLPNPGMATKPDSD